VGCHAVAVRLWRLEGENLIVATRTHGVRAIRAAKTRALTGEVARGAGHRSELLAERPRLTPE
jgi:hypothetical protein